MTDFNPTNMRGSIIPLVTPLIIDYSSGYRITLDSPSVDTLVNQVIGKGDSPLVNGLLVNGMTGEFIWLSEEIQKAMLDSVVEANNGRVPVIFNSSANTIEKTIELSQYAQNAGSDAIVLAPMYICGSDDGIVDSMIQIANSIKLPLYFYNNPAFGNNLNPEIYGELIGKIHNVYGIKDSSGDEELFKEYKRKSKLRQGIITFMGDEGKMIDHENNVPSYGNFNSERCKAFSETSNPGKRKELQDKINEEGKLIYCIDEIGSNQRKGLKYALFKRDIITSPLAVEPTKSLTELQMQAIDNLVLKNYK